MSGLTCKCVTCNCEFYSFPQITGKIKNRLKKVEINANNLDVIEKDPCTGDVHNFSCYIEAVRKSYFLKDKLKTDLRKFLRKQYVVIKNDCLRHSPKPPVTPSATPSV